MSPLLFVLVTTVLLADAVEMLGRPAKQAYDNGDLADCVYADDTLLIGCNDDFLNEFLAAVAAAGRRYGMELHWNKFQVLAVQSPGLVRVPEGDLLPHAKCMHYLGAHLTPDADLGHELNRKV